MKQIIDEKELVGKTIAGVTSIQDGFFDEDMILVFEDNSFVILESMWDYLVKISAAKPGVDPII